VFPPFEDGRKLRIFYGIDDAKRRVDFHSLSILSARPLRNLEDARPLSFRCAL
jgi:hypothetical protein